MNKDSSDPGFQAFTDEEIVQQIVSPSAEEDIDMEDDEDQDELTTTISSGQATDMLEQCLKRYEQQRWSHCMITAAPQDS